MFLSRVVKKNCYTCISPPRPVVPRSSTPATSEPKRIQRVQWIHLVIMVLIRGPTFLSSTALKQKRPVKHGYHLKELIRKLYYLFPLKVISVKRLRSLPKVIDWSWRSHSPPWSQIGQSKGWFTRRNSITPSRALRVNSELVLIRQPFITGMAQAATGWTRRGKLLLVYKQFNSEILVLWQIFQLQLNTFCSCLPQRVSHDSKILVFQLQP